MFEGIKIFSMLECVRSFSKKLDQHMTKQVDWYWSYEMDILIFENYLLIEIYPL